MILLIKTCDSTSEDGAWLCDLYERTSMLEEIERSNRLIVDDAYVPQPFLDIDIDKHIWMQVLATIDVSAMSNGPKFYDEFGYEIVPICMIQVQNTP